jgi:hypothetical protein
MPEQDGDGLVRGWDASGAIGVVKPDMPTVKEAVQKFFADATARSLAASQERRSSERRMTSPRSVPWTQIGQRALHPRDPFAFRGFA